jgi:hypothetical protein
MSDDEIIQEMVEDADALYRIGLNKGCFEGYIRGRYTVLKVVLKMILNGLNVKEIVENITREIKDIESSHPDLIKDLEVEL